MFSRKFLSKAPLLGALWFLSAVSGHAADCGCGNQEVRVSLNVDSENKDIVSAEVSGAGGSAGLGQSYTAKLVPGQSYPIKVTVTFRPAPTSGPVCMGDGFAVTFSCPLSQFSRTIDLYENDTKKDPVTKTTETFEIMLPPVSMDSRGTGGGSSSSDGGGGSTSNVSSPTTTVSYVAGTGIVQTPSQATGNAVIPLGFSKSGGKFVQAGFLLFSNVISTGSFGSGTFKLSSQFLESTAPEEAVRWAGGDAETSPRVAIAPEVVAKVTRGATVATVEIFERSAYDVATGVFSGPAIALYRYEKEPTLTTFKLLLSEWSGGDPLTGDPTKAKTYEVEGSQKLMVTENGLKETTQEILDRIDPLKPLSDPRNLFKLVTRTVEDGSEMISKVAEEYRFIPVNKIILPAGAGPGTLGGVESIEEVMISRVTSTSEIPAEDLTETWYYYGQEEAAAITDPEYHRWTAQPKLSVGSAGGWSLHGYDPVGNETVVFEPWQDAAIPDLGEIGFVDKDTVLVEGVTELPSKVRKTLISRELTTDTTSTTRRTYLVEGTSSIFIEDSTDNQSPGGGTTPSALSYSGTTWTHTQAHVGTWTPGSGNAWTEFVPGAVNPTHRMTVSTRGVDSETPTPHQYATNFYVLPEVSTQEISVFSGNQPVLTETRVLLNSAGAAPTAANFEPATRQTYTYDAKGRLTQVRKDGVLVSETDYESRWVSHTRTRSGLLTTTETDARGRTIATTTAAGGGVAEIVRTTEYLGLETVHKTNGALQSRSIVDLAGRPVHEEDATGAITTWSYSADGRVTTETRPGPNGPDAIKLITTLYRDGSTASVTGNATVATFYSYGFEPDPSTIGYPAGTRHDRTVTRRLGASDGPRYTKSIYYWLDGSLLRTLSPDAKDGSHEVILAASLPYSIEPGNEHATVGSFAGSTTSHPGYSGPAPAAQVNSPTYSAKGLLGFESHSGQVADWGYLTWNGASRLTHTESSYVKYLDGHWWLKTVQRKGIEEPHALRQSYTMRRLWEGNEFPNSEDNTAYAMTISMTEGGEEITTVTEHRFEEGSSTTNTTFTSKEVLRGEYRANGYLQWVQDGTSFQPMEFTYDGFGRVVETRDQRGGTTRTVYNAVGQVAKTIDALGRATLYAYVPANQNGAGQVGLVTKPDGTTSTYSYTPRGEVASIGGTSEYPVTYSYNAYGDKETLTTTNKNGQSVTRWEYNSAGLLLKKFYNWSSSHTSDPDGTIHHVYDPFGRLLERRVTGGKATGYNYNIFGELEKIDYGNDGTPDVDLVRDDAGLVERATENYEDAAGGEMGDGITEYHYAAGRLDTVEYLSGHSYLSGVKLDYKDADDFGRPSGYEVRNGSTKRLSVSYGYDGLGRFSTVGSEDGAGNPLHGTFVYGYHEGSGIVSGYYGVSGGIPVISQSRMVDFQNRTAAVVTKKNVEGPVIASVAYSHDAADRRIQARREDGSYWNYSYNPRGEVTSGNRHNAADQMINGLKRQYKYDELGNRKWAVNGSGYDDITVEDVPHYSYDVNAFNQYSSVETPNTAWVVGRAPAAETVNVNGVAAGRQGDWFSSELTVANSSGPASHAVEVTDASSSVAGGNLTVPKAAVAPEYDAAGNLELDSRWEYEWDSENRLRKMKSIAAGFPHQVIEFIYDWQGCRIAKKVTKDSAVSHKRYLYEGWNVVAEWSLTGGSMTFLTPQTYLWGLDLAGQNSGKIGNLQGAGGVGGLLAVNVVKPSDSTTLGNLYASYDGNGNILAWSSADGSIKQTQDYDALGNVVLRQTVFSGPLAAGEGELDYGFSTKPKDDETGMIYYGYRYYDPVTGRWSSRDLMEELGGVNLYSIAHNDTINRIDILGNLPIMGPWSGPYPTGSGSPRSGDKAGFMNLFIRFLFRAGPPINGYADNIWDAVTSGDEYTDYLKLLADLNRAVARASCNRTYTSSQDKIHVDTLLIDAHGDLHVQATLAVGGYRLTIPEHDVIVDCDFENCVAKTKIVIKIEDTYSFPPTRGNILLSPLNLIGEVYNIGDEREFIWQHNFKLPDR